MPLLNYISNLGLRTKTFIYVGAGLVALVVLLAVLSVQTVNQGIELASQEKLAVTKNIASSIEDIILHLRFETVYAGILLGNRWKETDAADNNERLMSLRQHLQRHLTSFNQPEVEAFVALTDARGNILQADPASDDEIGRSLANVTAVRKILDNEQEFYVEVNRAILTDESPTLSIAAPVKDGHELRGVIVVDIPAMSGNLDSLLQPWVPEHELQLINETGLVLAGSPRISNIQQSHHWESISPFIEEKIPGVGEYPGEEQIPPHIVAYSPLESVSLGVALEKEKDELLELPWAMGRRILIAGGVALLIAATLIWGFTRQLINPIRRLALVAEKFGEGDLEGNVPVMKEDEIGKLAQSLETMRHRLKDSIDSISRLNQDLEQRVEERTAALESLYKQLSQRDRERGDLIGKIISAQEEERLRIARELHDEVSQTLTGLGINLANAETMVRSHQPEAPGLLESLRQSTSDAIENIRRMIIDLRPSLLDDLGLIPAISWYVENYLASAGVEAKLEASGTEERLESAVEIALFRVIQEAITNIVKHADARTAHIYLKITPSTIIGDIADDGIGFSKEKLQQENSKGIGLLGMAERIELLKGKLKIDTNEGSGTRIHFEIPRQ